MDLITELKKQGFNIKGESGDELLPQKYVDNDPRKPKIEELEVHHDDDFKERRKAHELAVLRKRYDNFHNGVDIMENIQKIDIELMTSAPGNWNYLPIPNKSQLISLMASIENIGLINPIILLKTPDFDKYTIIEGKSRVMALKGLYANDPLDKYKFPICFILDGEKVDEYYIRAMIHDLNFNYRTIPQETRIKMLLERYELLVRSKQFRNESNIAEKLAEEFLMSTSTVYNYITLRKLTEEVMTLLLEKRITLQIARLFAKVKHDVQLMVLKNIDFKDIKSYHKMKYIITGPGKKDLETIKYRINRSKELVQENVSFTVNLNGKLIPRFAESLIDLKKYAVTQFSSHYTNINQYCKISFDEEALNGYVKKNVIDEHIVKKLEAKTIADLYAKISS